MFISKLNFVELKAKSNSYIVSLCSEKSFGLFVNNLKFAVGHCTALCRDPEAKTYTHYNDEKVMVYSGDMCSINPSEVYLLIYERVNCKLFLTAGLSPESTRASE